MTKEELKKIYLFWLSRKLNRPLVRPDYVGILLTKRCNLKCKMCDIRKHPTRPEEEVSLEEIIKIVEDVASWGVRDIVLSGGEPFIRNDFFEILDYASRKIDHTVYVNTNLTLIDENTAARLVELPHHKFYLETSLDGSTAETHDSIRGVKGCFDRIINNIKLIRKISKDRKTDVRIGVTYVLMKENLKETLDLIKLGKELNFANVSIMPAMTSNVELDTRDNKHMMNKREIGILNRVIEEIIEFKKKNGLVSNPEYILRLYPEYFQGKIKNISMGCYAGFMGPNICPDGEAFICKHLIGNIRHNSIKNIWHSRQASKVRKIAYNCKSPCLQHYAIRYSEANPFVATYWYLKEGFDRRKKPDRRKIDKAGRNINVAKPKGGKLKMLISDTSRLYPPLWGGPKRIWNLFSNVSENLFDITYVGVDHSVSNGKRYTFNRIRDNFKEVLSAFPRHYYLLRAIEEKIIRNPFLNLFSYLYMHTDRNFRHILDVQKAHVLICSHPWSSLSMRKDNGQVFIYDAHNCEYLLMDQILERHFLKPFILKEVKKAEGDACKKSDLILVCSEEEKKSFIRIYNVNPEQIYIIPNGSYVNQLVSAGEKELSKRKLGLPLDKRVVIFIAALYKPNIDAARFILHEIAPELKEFTFLMVGNIADAFKAGDIPNNVKFLGRVSEAKLSQALKSSDIAVNPMFSGSGVNIKMLDYMSYGLPIVATECGARGIKTNGKRPMIVCSAAKFMDNITILSKDDILYRRMSEDAVALVAEQYDWKKISNTLQNIILKKFR